MLNSRSSHSLIRDVLYASDPLHGLLLDFFLQAQILLMLEILELDALD